MISWTTKLYFAHTCTDICLWPRLVPWIGMWWYHQSTDLYLGLEWKTPPTGLYFGHAWNGMCVWSRPVPWTGMGYHRPTDLYFGHTCTGMCLWPRSAPWTGIGWYHRPTDPYLGLEWNVFTTLTSSHNDLYLGLEWDDIIGPLTRTLDWNGMCLRPRPAHTMICTLGLEWNVFTT